MHFIKGLWGISGQKLEVIFGGGEISTPINDVKKTLALTHLT